MSLFVFFTSCVVRDDCLEKYFSQKYRLVALTDSIFLCSTAAAAAAAAVSFFQNILRALAIFVDRVVPCSMLRVARESFTGFKSWLAGGNAVFDFGRGAAYCVRLPPRQFFQQPFWVGAGFADILCLLLMVHLRG